MYFYDKESKKIIFDENKIHIPVEMYESMRVKNEEYIANNFGYIGYKESTNELVLKDNYGYVYENEDGSIIAFYEELSEEEIKNQNKTLLMTLPASRISAINKDVLNGFTYYTDFSGNLAKVKLKETEYFDYKKRVIVSFEKLELNKKVRDLVSNPKDSLKDFEIEVGGAIVVLDNKPYFYPLTEESILDLKLGVMNVMDVNTSHVFTFKDYENLSDVSMSINGDKLEELKTFLKYLTLYNKQRMNIWETYLHELEDEGDMERIKYLLSINGKKERVYEIFKNIYNELNV